MARSLVWITGFSVVSFVANLIVLLGCTSPSGKDLALYRVNVASLAASIVKQTKNKEFHDVSELLDSGPLSTWWYWGMSGICDVDDVRGETRCHGGFPSTKSLLTVIEDSLHQDDDNTPPSSPTSSSSSSNNNSSKVLSAWKTAIANLPGQALVNKESRFTLQGKASAYLVIAAVVLDFASPFLAWIVSELSSSRIHPYAPSFLSGLITVAAGSLAILAMNNGPRGLITTDREYGVGGIIVLFINGILRLAFSVSAPKVFSESESSKPHIVWSSSNTFGNGQQSYLPSYQPQQSWAGYQTGTPYIPAPPNPLSTHQFQPVSYQSPQQPWTGHQVTSHQAVSANPPSNQQFELPSYRPPRPSAAIQHRPERLENAEIGYLGELYIYDLFEQNVRGWTFENWTSKLRSRHGRFPEFPESEWRYSDFTYVDKQRSGSMLAFLGQLGVDTRTSGWSLQTKFHLEVKTTPADLGKTFYVSKNQLRRMKEYDRDPLNAYILVRVYKITERRPPGVEYYPNPYSLSRTLDFGPQNENGDTEVCVRTRGNAHL